MMVIMSHILLADSNSMMRLDILAWVLGVPVVVVLLAVLYMQVKHYYALKGELAQLAKVKRHNIEYELVLKAMKLSTWRIDVPQRTITFESDYRDKANTYVPQADSPVMTMLRQIVDADKEKVRETMLSLMEGRQEDMHLQYQVMIPHSTNTYWSETFATVDKRDIAGNPLTIVGTSMRIDERKEIEHALIDARNHAEESDRLKSAFLANITHEVRTPLNAIVGFSDILPMAQSEEERNELIKLIKQNNAHLLRLFDDMMNMSKLEAGDSGSVVKEDFQIVPLLREIVEKYMSLCVEKNLEVFVEESDVEDIVHTDRDRLKEILNQYMNNAVKFTSAGSISIGYEKRSSGVRLWISDTGKGIPADKCNEHLFERFVKVDDFVPGTGLGLSICRSLAKAIGGTVGVESVFEKGSTFWVDIPI
ncbi:MAG: HAMP domain-containing histidine kinase [Prevotella sp.]|nr:HAMP domain-containing histidine kinase [Prevotella sp.]